SKEHPKGLGYIPVPMIVGPLIPPLVGVRHAHDVPGQPESEGPGGAVSLPTSQTCRPVVSICAGRTVIPSATTARRTRCEWSGPARIVTVPPPPAPLALKPTAPAANAAPCSASISRVVMSGCNAFCAAQLAFI